MSTNKKRAAEATRPTAQQLQSRDIISAVTAFVIVAFITLAIGGEQLLIAFGVYQ